MLIDLIWKDWRSDGAKMHRFIVIISFVVRTFDKTAWGNEMYYFIFFCFSIVDFQLNMIFC